MTYRDNLASLIRGVTFSDMFLQTLEVSTPDGIIEVSGKLDSIRYTKTEENSATIVMFTTKFSVSSALLVLPSWKFRIPDETIGEYQELTLESNKWWAIDPEMGIHKNHSGITHVYLRIMLRTEIVGQNTRTKYL